MQTIKLNDLIPILLRFLLERHFYSVIFFTVVDIKNNIIGDAIMKSN